MTDRSWRDDHGSRKTTAAVFVVLLAGLAAACGDNDSVEPVAAASCGELLYEGEGKPDAIVVTDNPRRGVHAAATKEVVDAIEHVLRRRDFRAGEFRVGFQSCDYTVAGEPDAGQCRRNAQAFVETGAVVGVIGPYNSGCAEIQIPILSRAAAGPLAMVSPANTDEGLTRGLYALPLYPDGVRNYARVVTHDQGQGIAAARLADESGARRAAVVAMRGLEERYVGQLTESFRATARELGIESKSYDWLFRGELRRSRGVDHRCASGRRLSRRATRAEREDAHRGSRASSGRGSDLTPDSFAADDVARGLGSDRRWTAHDRTRHPAHCAAPRREEVPP